MKTFNSFGFRDFVSFVSQKETHEQNKNYPAAEAVEQGSIFKTRHHIIANLRNYLIERDFIEVETPVLANQAGGATAKPFITYHNAMKQEMH